jgi:lysylphosphatidylglycerol synthetase-like protein (DUF2156 family)
MYRTDFALAVIGWAPYVVCLFATMCQPKSWSAIARVIFSVVWVLLGWVLVVAYVELAQFAAAINASTDQELLDLYSSDGAARAFAALFGWLLPLGGVVSGLALRALFSRLAWRQDRPNYSLKRTDQSLRD